MDITERKQQRAGAAPLARPHRRGGRGRAAAPRAQPPRRRAAAARLALARAPARAGEGRDRPGARPWRSSARRATSWRSRWRSCASSRAGSTRPCSPTAASTAALETLAARAPLPVELQTPAERLAPPVEAAAYYVVVGGARERRQVRRGERRQRHGRAARRRTSWSRSPTTASAARSPHEGSGLSGLADRVDALDGTLRVESPAGPRNADHGRDPGRVRRRRLRPLPSLERVTFLFTDIEGSTRILREHGEAYTGLLADYRRLVRGTVGRAGGREVDCRGDEVFAAFDEARARSRRPWRHSARSRRTRGRTGSSSASGSASTRAERRSSDGDYVGLDVHRAARISQAGHGGQILVSEPDARRAGRQRRAARTSASTSCAG